MDLGVRPPRCLSDSKLAPAICEGKRPATDTGQVGRRQPRAAAAIIVGRRGFGAESCRGTHALETRGSSTGSTLVAAQPVVDESRPWPDDQQQYQRLRQARRLVARGSGARERSTNVESARWSTRLPWIRSIC